MTQTEYFSLYLVPECDISYIPPPSPATPLHPTLTHLSIINFRVPPSFLTTFPCLIEATITLLLTPLQNQLVQLQYRPKDVQAILLALPTTLQKLTVTCTNLPPEILALAAQRFPSLTHLSFVWVDAPDRPSGGVETTDITPSLHQYVEAIAPLANTLQALYLPACVGVPSSAAKFAPSLLPKGDELLGEGPVLLSTPSPTEALMNPRSLAGSGFMGVNRVLGHGRISVGMKGLLDACKTLVKGVGGVRTGNGSVVGVNGMHKLVKIGWLVPQGDDLPLLPIECLRRRGVVKFGANMAPLSEKPTPVLRESNFNRSMNTSQRNVNVFSSLSSPTTRHPNARSVPITHIDDIELAKALAQATVSGRPPPPMSPPPVPVYREETEYWYPSMEFSDGCAWPAFAEVEAVFPRPAFMRY
ncbi:hypothetical protein FRC17_003148 [Serendipita sp. 399]|nr:hypothetical protein FRC17_003148 [Serendipita sp. 399]